MVRANSSTIPGTLYGAISGTLAAISSASQRMMLMSRSIMRTMWGRCTLTITSRPS